MLWTGIMASVCVETAGDFMERIRWGILGAGSIAQRFVAALARVEGAEFVSPVIARRIRSNAVSIASAAASLSPCFTVLHLCW